MEANALLKLMKERRSFRQFEDKQIIEEDLHRILEAGLYAPNAGGRQSAIFLVTQDKEINENLGRINRATMSITPGKYVNKAQPSIIDQPNLKSAFYGAPTIITLLAPQRFLYSEADCAVAAQNMLLMAHTLGLGGCMIARTEETMKSDYAKRLLKEKGINEDYKGCYHIILGYPKGDTVVKERKKRIY